MSTTRTDDVDDDTAGDPRPADAVACGALGCTRTDDLGLVERADGAARVLCPTHRKYFLGVSS